MNLLAALMPVSDERELLVSSLGSYLKKDLINERSLRSNTLKVLRGKKIALLLLSNLEIAKWLFFLDGIVEQLLIIPHSATKENVQLFLTQSSTEVLLVEEDAEFEIQSINIHKSELSGSSQTFSMIDTSWVITTSGTTGTPKLVSHTFASLTRMSKKSLSSNTWGLLYGLDRFAGLQVYLQSMIAGNTLVISESGQNLEKILVFFSENKVNCLSATPSYWRKILMNTTNIPMDLTSLTLGGEISDQNILSALANKFPKAKVCHIYASTEGGTGFSVNDTLAGFPLSYLRSGINGTELKISKNNTLLIRSESRAQKYLGDNLLHVRADGFFETGDLIEIKGERCYFNGRENGSINVGGNKVQPENVERVMLNYPGIALVKVYPKQSPIMGSLVQANIVLNSNINDSKSFIDGLRSFCNEHLEAFMVPAIIRIVDDIELNATGKVCRNG